MPTAPLAVGTTRPSAPDAAKGVGPGSNGSMRREETLQSPKGRVATRSSEGAVPNESPGSGGRPETATSRPPRRQRPLLRPGTASGRHTHPCVHPGVGVRGDGPRPSVPESLCERLEVRDGRPLRRAHRRGLTRGFNACCNGGLVSPGRKSRAASRISLCNALLVLCRATETPAAARGHGSHIPTPRSALRRLHQFSPAVAPWQPTWPSGRSFRQRSVQPA